MKDLKQILQLRQSVHAYESGHPKAKTGFLHSTAKSLHSRNSHAEAMVVSAEAYLSEGDYIHSLDSLETGLRMDPCNFKLHSKASDILYNTGQEFDSRANSGNSDGFLPVFERLVKWGAETHAMQFHAIALYIEAEAFDKAKDLLLRLKAVAPAYPQLKALESLLPSQDTKRD